MKTTKWLIVLILFTTVLFACNKDNPAAGQFELCAVADTIQSYPGGGGVFIAYIRPLEDFGGPTTITWEASALLNVEVTKDQLLEGDTVFELVVKPDAGCNYLDYKIRLMATNQDEMQALDLVVSVVDNSNNPEALPKLNEFRQWLTERDPEAAAVLDSDYFLYKTYQLLVVEHYTVLTPDYEIRFCYHVMIPPDDWSMIRVRKRNVIEPEFAARRESDGTINEIPVSEYPSMFGY